MVFPGGAKTPSQDPNNDFNTPARPGSPEAARDPNTRTPSLRYETARSTAAADQAAAAAREKEEEARRKAAAAAAAKANTKSNGEQDHKVDDTIHEHVPTPPAGLGPNQQPLPAKPSI